MIRIKKFNDFILNEASVKADVGLYKKAFDACTLISKGSIPLTDSIVNGINKEKIRVSVFHLTSIDGIDGIYNIQGKRNAISCFTTISNRKIKENEGIATNGGALIKLEGDLILNSKIDIWSEIDKTGRKWVPTKDHAFSILKSGIERILNSDSRYNTICSEPQSIRIQLIKKYISSIERFISNNPKTIQSILDYITSDIAYHQYEDPDQGLYRDLWDELLVNNIKVIDVVVNSEITQEKKEEITDKFKNIEGEVYFNPTAKQYLDICKKLGVRLIKNPKDINFNVNIDKTNISDYERLISRAHSLPNNIFKALSPSQKNRYLGNRIANIDYNISTGDLSHFKRDELKFLSGELLKKYIRNGGYLPIEKLMSIDNSDFSNYVLGRAKKMVSFFEARSPRSEKELPVIKKIVYNVKLTDTEAAFFLKEILSGCYSAKYENSISITKEYYNLFIELIRKYPNSLNFNFDGIEKEQIKELPNDLKSEYNRILLKLKTT